MLNVYFGDIPNSSIYHWLTEHKDENVRIIADGAAFGAEMDRVIKLGNSDVADFCIYLPESFEWLLLKSGLIKTENIQEVLDHPSDFIHSEEYFSWEQFFTAYLERNTQGTPFQYSKSDLKPVYLIRKNAEKIVEEIKLEGNRRETSR